MSLEKTRDKTGFEYIIKGIVHSGLLNPWKVNKEGIFVEPTKQLNKLAQEGWELINVIQQEIMIEQVLFKKTKKINYSDNSAIFC